jgi:hypothetical protein
MIGTTLVAAATGFLAILYQVRSSSRQLRDHIKAQRDADLKELERQKNAIATAILFEIDNFYLYHLRGVRAYLDDILQRRQLPEVVRIPPALFAVYQGNTTRLGELPSNVAQAVVHFYSKALQFFALREECRDERERLGPNVLLPGGTKAFTLAGHLRDSLPGLTRAAHIACKRLGDFTGIDFRAPGITVAEEEVEVLNRDTERIEHEEVHRL